MSPGCGGLGVKSPVVLLSRTSSPERTAAKKVDGSMRRTQAVFPAASRVSKAMITDGRDAHQATWMYSLLI